MHIIIKLLMLTVLVALSTGLAPVPALAEALGPENILIRNVTMIDPTGKTEDKNVNILIRGRKLDVITEDKISRDEAEQIINADGGFILGKLEVGEPPSFMILSEDPREDFEVLMDTRTYARLAVHEGGVPVSRSVYQNGKGAWELTARWSNVDLNDGRIEGGDMDIASLGLSWWLTPFFGVNMNYRYIWNTRNGVQDTSSGFNSRVVLLLE